MSYSSLIGKAHENQDNNDMKVCFSFIFLTTLKILSQHC